MTAERSDEIWDEIQRKAAEFEVEAAKVGLYHRGYRFWPPYACGRCGEPIGAYQFAFARSCGACDRSESPTARLSIVDPRWFVLGKAELENAHDSALIHPEFIPAHRRKEFALVDRQRPRIPPVPLKPLKPKPQKPFPPRMRLGGVRG